MDDVEFAYRAVTSRDARFDGVFFTGVVTTGIYCRPSCPARTPDRVNVRIFKSAAAARTAGFRACRRCRPDAAPGSPQWDLRADTVARAVRMIRDGVVDREGVGGLARRLGYSERQVLRHLRNELGAGPLELARAQRADTARTLLESTTMPVGEVAFAAGFGSVRQFNDAIRHAFGLRPSEIRARRAVAAAVGGSGTVTLRLPVRTPFPLRSVLEFLGRRAVPGVESYGDGVFRRVLRLPYGFGTVAVVPSRSADHGSVDVELLVADLRDLSAAVSRTRRLLDLDADPVAVDDVLGRDVLLAPLVTRLPGLRVPGHTDPAELAMRAVLGQQVSVAASNHLAGRLVRRLGEDVAVAGFATLRAFPTPEVVAAADPADLGMPLRRATTLVALARALADGVVDLGPGADRVRSVAALRALPGIGAWTAGYIAMRGLGDPDAFPTGDLGVRHALEGLGFPAHERFIDERSDGWRPWRSYALMYLWSSLAAARDATVAGHTTE